MRDTGAAGENWLAAALQQRGWQVVAQRWRCPWGELDLVMWAGDTLVFVEVKTRRDRNWDADGAAAVTPTKQERLRQAAAFFLSQHPQWQNAPCRFDVALVRRRGRHYSLQAYLPGALC
ncbi:MAG: YraN family protein [Gloeomargarita sp. SKYBB_i_bin120]|nr:YraN family protein [Gloeomargarita sp. SKYG98]MCS7292316.1 YraN family protein [Gloeomargarita sp. SKYB120]MDW8177876.1 YraN family protein [Gloeomargarita sp. SKYBB_i_bin120]